MKTVLSCQGHLLLVVTLLNWTAIAYGQFSTMDSQPIYGHVESAQQYQEAPIWYAQPGQTSCSDSCVTPWNSQAAPFGPFMPDYGPGCQMPLQGYYEEAQPFGWPASEMIHNACGTGACGNPSVWGSGCNDPACGYGASNFQQCCPNGKPTAWWYRADALIWHASSVRLPRLVTPDEFGAGQQGFEGPGNPAPQTLYGGNSIFNGSQGGYRLRSGHYFDEAGTWGLDSEVFMLGTERFRDHAEFADGPIVDPPFLNANSGMDDAQMLDFPQPGIGSGTIDIVAKTRLKSGAIHYREVFWQEYDPGHASSPLFDGNGPESFSMGFQIGPRYVNLRESFGVDGRFSEPDMAIPLRIQDSFRARNQFWGCELGLFASRQVRRWSLDGGARLAIGATKQSVEVYGLTSANLAGLTITAPGGFLTQPANSGSWERNRFALVPQFDLSLGYQLTDTWKFSVGYSLMYWGRVVRATDQIDPVLNPGVLSLLQPPLPGDYRPDAAWRQSDYLAQGITLGLEKSW